MRRLRLSAEGERGAVAILVAILLPLVFIGMAALTVDVGNISAERRQLQNGADAVALSAAMEPQTAPPRSRGWTVNPQSAVPEPVLGQISRTVQQWQAD